MASNLAGGSTSQDERQKFQADIDRLKSALEGEDLLDDDYESDENRLFVAETSRASLEPEKVTATSSNLDQFEDEDVNYRDEDDNDIFPIVEDGELAVDPKTGLALNKLYQEIIADILNHISEAQAQNKKRQAEVRAAMEDKTRERMASSRKKPLGVYAKPYFKDVHGMVPPPNDDALYMKKQESFDAENIQLNRTWKNQEKKILQKAVLVDIKKNLMRPIMNKKELECGKIENAATDDEVNEIKARIEEYDKKLDVMKLLKEEDLYWDNDISEGLDWMKISTIDFDGNRSALNCELAWKNAYGPHVKTTKFSAEEDARLLTMAEKYNFRNWVAIANDMNTGRNAFQCLQRYQTKLNPCLQLKWSTEEEEFLQEAVESCRSGRSIQWNKVADLMEGRSQEQCVQKWGKLQESYKKGKWTEQEDMLLTDAVNRFGTKWNMISTMVPTRSQVQCRERWSNCLSAELNRSKWTREEDKKIWKAGHKYKEGSWAQIAAILPGRTDAMVRSRYRRLQSFDRKIQALVKLPSEQTDSLISPELVKVAAKDLSRLSHLKKLDAALEKKIKAAKRLHQLRHGQTTPEEEQMLTEVHEKAEKIQCEISDLSERNRQHVSKMTGEKELLRQIKRDIQQCRYVPMELCRSPTTKTDSGKTNLKLQKRIILKLKKLARRGNKRSNQSFDNLSIQQILKVAASTKNTRPPRRKRKIVKSEPPIPFDVNTELLRLLRVRATRRKPGRPRKYLAETVTARQDAVRKKDVNDALSEHIMSVLLKAQKVEHTITHVRNTQVTTQSHMLHLATLSSSLENTISKEKTGSTDTSEINKNSLVQNNNNALTTSDEVELPTSSCYLDNSRKDDRSVSSRPGTNDIEHQVHNDAPGLITEDQSDITADGKTCSAVTIKQPKLNSENSATEADYLETISSENILNVDRSSDSEPHGESETRVGQEINHMLLQGRDTHMYDIAPLPPTVCTLNALKTLLLQRRKLLETAGPYYRQNALRRTEQTSLRTAEPTDGNSTPGTAGTQSSPEKFSRGGAQENGTAPATSTQPPEQLVHDNCDPTDTSSPDKTMNYFGTLQRVRQTHDYRQLKSRFVSLFVWPALLSTLPVDEDTASTQQQHSSSQSDDQKSTSTRKSVNRGHFPMLGRHKNRKNFLKKLQKEKKDNVASFKSRKRKERPLGDERNDEDHVNMDDSEIRPVKRGKRRKCDSSKSVPLRPHSSRVASRAQRERQKEEEERARQKQEERERQQEEEDIQRQEAEERQLDEEESQERQGEERRAQQREEEPERQGEEVRKRHEEEGRAQQSEEERERQEEEGRAQQREEERERQGEEDREKVAFAKASNKDSSKSNVRSNMQRRQLGSDEGKLGLTGHKVQDQMADILPHTSLVSAFSKKHVKTKPVMPCAFPAVENGGAVVTAEHVSPSAVTAEHVSASAVTAEHVSPSAVTAEHVSPSAVTAEHVSPSAVTAERVSPSAVTAEHVSPVLKLRTGVAIHKNRQVEESVRHLAREVPSQVKPTLQDKLAQALTKGPAHVVVHGDRSVVQQVEHTLSDKSSRPSSRVKKIIVQPGSTLAKQVEGMLKKATGGFGTHGKVVVKCTIPSQTLRLRSSTSGTAVSSRSQSADQTKHKD